MTGGDGRAARYPPPREQTNKPCRYCRWWGSDILEAPCWGCLSGPRKKVRKCFEPAGDVVMTWSALANHDAPVPSPVTQTLAPNGSTTFTGAYTRHKGTVQVSVTPDAASWSFTDGDGGAHNGTGDASMANIPTGTITLTWNALTGYRTPSVNPEGKALGKGGTVTFVGTYSSALSPARAGDWMLYE